MECVSSQCPEQCYIVHFPLTTVYRVRETRCLQVAMFYEQACLETKCLPKSTSLTTFQPFFTFAPSSSFKEISCFHQSIL